MTIFLCGFMGCGKSTIGQRLAKKLNCPFTDMDSYIEEQTGMRIPEIFEKHGEPYFRDLETEAIRDLAGQPGVIACGGGAMLRDENAKIARKNGTVVFLDVPFRMCYQRISQTDRPIVQCSTRQELQTLYQKRQGIYCRHGNYRIEAIHKPAQTVQEIIKKLQLQSGNTILEKNKYGIKNDSLYEVIRCHKFLMEFLFCIKKRQDITVNVKKQDIVVNVKKQDIVANVKKQDIVVSVKKQDIVVSVKKQDIVANVKKQDIAVNVKKQDIVVNVYNQREINYGDINREKAV